MSKTTETVDTDNFSFKEGWLQLQQKDVKAAKQELMDALHITSEPAFHHKLNGKYALKESQVAAIENVFKKYNITNIWGNTL